MSSNTSTVYDMSESDLRSALIGKKVVHVDTNTNQLALSDGTTLEFEDTSDCCAYFNAQLQAGNFSDNAITAATREEAGSEYDEHWILHVLAGDDRIASVDIDGTSSSGYYCHSVNLVIHAPKENS